MARIREEVQIEAPVEGVWHAVHEDLRGIPKWSRNIARVELLSGGVVGKGSAFRYDVKLPGGRIVGLEFVQTTYNKPRRCAGNFVNGPVKGSWSYSYRDLGDATHMLFEADYELGGMLRFLGAVFHSQYAAGVRENLQSLKQYLEKAAGHRADRGKPERPPRSRPAAD